MLLTGDIIQVVADQRRVSFMYSYPNLILPASKVAQMANRVKKISFESLYRLLRIVKDEASKTTQAFSKSLYQGLNGEILDI